MKTFILLLGLVVLSISCGQVEEEPVEGPGARFELAALEGTKNSELKNIASACEALDFKEKYYRRNYAGKGTIFQFSSQKKDCLGDQSVKYATGAKIEFSNGEMTFSKMASGAVIFEDIVLRNHGVMREFCDRVESGNLSKRYIRSGKTAKIIYVKTQGKDILIAIDYALDLDRDGEFVKESRDQMRIINTQNKFWGVVTERAFETTAGCSAGGKMVLSIKLNKIL